MTVARTVRVGSRRSRLALAQTAIAAEALRPTLGPVEIVAIATRGDEISERRPQGGWVESDGQFTRDLERALLDGDVDLVVHSFKDLPTDAVQGLVIGAVLERADARDCLLSASGGGGLDAVPMGGRVGTSSPRRAAQLAASRPDLVAVPLRGNVESRLRRLYQGEFEALVVAAAGLDRLGVDVTPESRLPYEVMLPAPAQGALAVQVRADDGAIRRQLASADHPPTRIAVEAERALLRMIGGGCLAPLGALGEVDGDLMRLRAALGTPSGMVVRSDARGPATDAASVVESAAQAILAHVARA